MLNKIWSLLDSSNTEIDTELAFRRKVIPNQVYISAEKKAALADIFKETDPSIRGWLVEAALRAALNSSYADRLMEFDPINTYDIPIIDDFNTFSYTPKNITIIPIVIDAPSLVYQTDATLTLEEGEYTGTINGVPVVGAYTEDGGLSSVIPVSNSRGISILFTDTTEFPLTVSVTFCTLPRYAPVRELCERIDIAMAKRHLKLRLNNTNSIEKIGSFIWQIVS